MEGTRYQGDVTPHLPAQWTAEDLAERNREHVPTFSIMMTEEECRELSAGRIPALVQEMAKTLTDWTQEDLRRNAAKKGKR